MTIRKYGMVFIFFFGLLATGSRVNALSTETEYLLKLLEKKGIITQSEVEAFARAVESSGTEMNDDTTNTVKGSADDHYHSVKGLDQRINKIEDDMAAREKSGKWTDNISLNGLIEVEVNYERAIENASDITLATVELGTEADIADNVKGYVLLKWEEDETEPIEIDEGVIIIDSPETPFFLNLGKMYVPFGQFDSHFISDPITLEIGETNQSTVKVGLANDWFEACLAVFNGDIDETGDNNHIDSIAGSIIMTIPEGILPDIQVSSGVSYMSNIGDSDGLEGETPGQVVDHVGGISAFLSVAFSEKLFFNAEYLGALEAFSAGELSFDGGNMTEPKSWNIELAYAFTEKLELAAKYEGSNDLGDFMPERQHGVALIYNLFNQTSLALEYLYGRFENDTDRDLFTSQLAIEF